MRALAGVIFFVGVVLVISARIWQGDPIVPQASLSDAVAQAAFWTPLFATFAMPTRASLLIYPLAVFALWMGAGYVGQHFIPEPKDQRYICGLASLAFMFAAFLGIVTGVIGRALGFTVREAGGSAVVTYLVQLIPFGTLFALGLMMAR